MTKGRVLVPQDNTHKQTITDVYKIYKTSYSKCYDSEEEIFFSDVVHHLEQHSATTQSETDSIYKYKVEDKSLSDALSTIPTWSIGLPKNYGVNQSVSLSCLEKEAENSPLIYIDDMGIEMIEYVKLRIGYNYLKTNLSKPAGGDKYDKTICPGLTGGFEDPIVLRMLHMKYINSEDYLKWVLRSRRKDGESKKKEFKSEESTSVATKQNRSESLWRMGKDTFTPLTYSTSVKDEDIKNDYLFDATYDEKRKEELPLLNANELQHIIMLTQYEVTDQELPDDIDIFWPGKRDLENDFVIFKAALSENILYRQFIQRFKSGKLERLDDDIRQECKNYFIEANDCQTRKQLKSMHTMAEKKQPTGEKKKCSWEKLKEKFKDYTISQDITFSLFDNMIKERTKLEDLNLCCIISKLKEIHKENTDETDNEGDLIWKDMVIVRTKSKDSQGQIIEEEVISVISGEQLKDTSPQKQDESSEDEDYDVLPEFRSMIYVTKVFPNPGIGYKEDKCKAEYSSEKLEPKFGMKGGCTGYSMKDYKPPLVPKCSFKTTPTIKEENSITSVASKQGSMKSAKISAISVNSADTVQKGDYVTFHTDWSNYPYTEMIDIVFHRHHQGYIYITDVFEIEPDKLREIERIFHKTGKYSEEQSTKHFISSYTYHDAQTIPSCCQFHGKKPESCFEDFPFILSPEVTHLGEDKLIIKNKYKGTKGTQLSYQRTRNSQSNVYYSPIMNVPTHFPPIEDADYIKIQNLQIEQEKGDNSQDSSSSSTDELNISDTEYYLNRFKTSQVSSVGFDSHTDLEKEFPICVDYNDKQTIGKRITPDEDDYSDIVDFIKNFRFGEKSIEKPTNYEKPPENPEYKEKGVFIDLLSSNSSQTNEDFIKLKKTCDDFSVNSDDSISLKDLKGFLTKKTNCNHEVIIQSNINELIAPQPPRRTPNVTGEFYDAIIDKRRSVIQELRTSFPLIYLYLTLKTNFSKINITGRLAKYKKYFRNLNHEYQTVLIKYNFNERGDQSNVKELIPHRHILYQEMFGKYKTFSTETFSMSICNPFIRHLIIRESFQDVVTNLSFFLLQFIENDRFNLLYKDNKKENIEHEKIMNEVGKFLQLFRVDKRYKRFLLDVVIIHYFETKKYFSLGKLIQLDLNWEEIFQIPREIKIDEDILNINYKDCVLQNCADYTYMFFSLIKQFNSAFTENNIFRQFLEPELHPKLIISMTSAEIEDLKAKVCSEFCESLLITELEIDMLTIIKTIWKCEILGINYCGLSVNHIINRFSNETANYLLHFFPNIFKIHSARNEEKQIWKYNREFHYWYNDTGQNNVLLTKNNLFHFEKLLTICLLQFILAYYEYGIHG